MTEALAVLPSFSKLSSRVWRVLGLNPGKFTLQGTNTYLLGAGAKKVLLDCGEGKPEYLDLLKESLQQTQPDAYISDIIISHGHLDHWGGLAGILSSSLASRPIQVHKYPLPLGYTLTSMQDFPAIVTQDLKDQQVFTAEDVTLRVIYTPGHTQDHCTFWLEEEKSLFTVDCVLGQGTAVFEDLQAYMAGLERLLALEPRRLYPGHGPLIEHGVAKIQEYIGHRLAREQQIIQLLQKGPLTPLEIVQVLYKDYPQSLHAPATHNILLHLKKLQAEAKVGHGVSPLEPYYLK
ncbi:beta-lactamase-like protein 2-like protein [Sporodiniella umbellata]|nr:beta-lactamase-like protein 2-like protein [Sporodiniella umbellata]